MRYHRPNTCYPPDLCVAVGGVVRTRTRPPASPHGGWVPGSATLVPTGPDMQFPGHIPGTALACQAACHVIGTHHASHASPGPPQPGVDCHRLTRNASSLCHVGNRAAMESRSYQGACLARSSQLPWVL